MARTMKAHGFNAQEECKDYWRKLWDTHINDVRAHMANLPGQLVEFNIDTDDIQTLVDALPAYHLDKRAWEDHGRSRNRNNKSMTNRLKRIWSHIRPRNY